MKKANIEKSIRRALEKAPTIDFDKLANEPVVKMTKHDYITNQQVERAPQCRRKLLTAFALCFVMLICFSSWFFQYRMPGYVVTLDINPSIELVINKQNRVLSARASNEGAKEVFDEKSLKNMDLRNAVNAILDSMISHGYLSRDKNVIMVSVENKDAQKADALTVVLDEVIQEAISPRKISIHVLRQTFAKDKDASALAKKYSVSTGKIKLINEILSGSNKFSLDDLSHKTIDELVLIANENAIDLSRIIKFDDDYFNNRDKEDLIPSDTDIDDRDEDDPINDADSDDDSLSDIDGNDSSEENDQDNNSSDDGETENEEDNDHGEEDEDVEDNDDDALPSSEETENE